MMKSVIVKDNIALNALNECLNEFFGSEVRYLAGAETPMQGEIAPFVFEYTLLKGDFSFELSIYGDKSFDGEELASLICKKFDTAVLMSDNDINPYSWILMTKEGKCGVVTQVVREDDIFLIRR